MSFTVIGENLSVAGRLDNVNVACRGGQQVHILGKNGAGKSTLLQVLAGLLPAHSGQVLLNGTPLFTYSLAGLAQWRGFLAQSATPTFALRTAEFIGMFSADRAMPQWLVEHLELQPLMQRPLNQLSGGELQRVNIARSIAQVLPALEGGQGLLLLDEPLQGLDIVHQQDCLQLFSQLVELGNTLLISCHDLAITANHADQIWLLSEGELRAAGSPKDVMHEAILQKVFGGHFDCHWQQGIWHYSLRSKSI